MKAWKYRYVGIGILLIVLMFLLFGCNMVPTEQASTLQQKQREAVTGQAVVGVSKATDIEPANLTITTKGGEVKVEQPVHQHSTAEASVNAGESSDSASSGSSEWSVKIPLFAKIIGLAIGVGMIFGLIWFARRSSKAVDEAFNAGDSVIAAQIHKVRSMAMQTTEPAVTTALATMAGDMERERTNFHKAP